MSPRIEELDWAATPMGDLTLRRRRDPVAGVEVFEVKLGEEFLMSSLFTVAEIELATRALGLLDGDDLDVVVGGLGLGYTAAAALEDPRVRSLIVVERLAPVIQWHERRLVPSAVPSSARTRLVNEDFFALAAASGFDPDSPDRRFDAILLDVDHSPRHLLSPAHADLYTPDGTRLLANRLHPGRGLRPVVERSARSRVRGHSPDGLRPACAPRWWSSTNPLQGRPATNTVYLADAPS